MENRNTTRAVVRVLAGGVSAVLLCNAYIRYTVCQMDNARSCAHKRKQPSPTTPTTPAYASSAEPTPSASAKQTQKIQLSSTADASSSNLAGKSQSAAVASIGVNALFVGNMRRLLPILLPHGVRSRETGMLFSLATVLVARTWLDIWFSGFNGSVVQAIVSRNKRAFVSRAVVEFGIMMWPLSIVNNSLKLCISSISLAFRSRLTRHAHNLYLNNLAFYSIAASRALDDPDHLITQDIDRFSDSFAHLYSNIVKPSVDICLFAYKLGQAIGGPAPLLMVSYFFVSGVLLRSMSPPFGRYAAQEQTLEADFRFTHSRIITHNEEIAFFAGGNREQTLANDSYSRIVKHLAQLTRLRFANGIIDSVFVKYLATMLAYTLLARPVFKTSEEVLKNTDEVTSIVESYQRNSGYLVNLSQAVGRLLLAGREMTRFAGYSARVSKLFEVLETTKHTVVPRDSGTILIENNVIAFDEVPIVTPAGDVLVEKLSFRVEKGMNCIITGPNGCGKSSLFRILGGLWPLAGGKLTKPPANMLFYVPQKPYLVLGTLRDQVIYPHSASTAKLNGTTDDVILQLLDKVKLGYLVDRESGLGLDAVKDWAAALSGGEKQRIAMARLFYHKPQFAVLDECTSAVSIDVEGMMYEYAKSCGITLFTVSHRSTLFKYHEYMLQFDGVKNYTFGPLSNNPTSPFATFSSNNQQLH